MNHTPATPANAPDVPHPAAEFAATLDSIFACILLMLAAHFRPLGAFNLLMWTRFSRARVRLAALLARLAAGTYRTPRPHPPRPGQKGGTPAPYSPRGYFWLIRKLGYHAAGYGSQLNHLLHTPQTQALLATTPPAALAAMSRTLRPLCHLLAIDLPPQLRLSPRKRTEPEPEPEPPPPPRQPKPKTPKPAPERPRLPFYPQRKPRFTLYPDPPRKTRPA